jgi:mono/diheme cytochrome c family protein
MNHSIIVSRCLVFVLMLLATGVVMAGDPMKGRPLYDTRCAGCHGPEGIPQVAGIPNFKMGEKLMQPDQQILRFVKKGKGVMPGFKGILTDGEITDIIAHIRTFF